MINLTKQFLLKAFSAAALGVLLVIVFISQGIMSAAMWLHSVSVCLCYRLYPKATRISIAELVQRAKEVYVRYAHEG